MKHLAGRDRGPGADDAPAGAHVALDGLARYARFAALALSLGAVTVVASLYLAPGARPSAIEVVGQLLLILVLAGALYRGRNGGFLAALVATAVYVAMWVPQLQAEGLSGTALTALGIRSFSYGMVGVIGGEAAGRLKYLFARVGAAPAVDPETGAYNQAYAAAAIRTGLARWEREQVPYAVVRLAAPRAALEGLGSRRRRQVLRQAASHIRNDIRMVDDLASEAPGVFLALLPSTAAAGATVLCRRLVAPVAACLGVAEEAVAAAVLATDDDLLALRRLADALDPSAVARTGASAHAALDAGPRDQEPVA